MPLLCRLDPAFFTTPTHDRSVWSEPAHQDLVPADELTSLAIEIFLDTPYHVALELMIVLEALDSLTFGALGAVTPVAHRSFVPADMNVLGGEECHDFIEDRLEEGEGLLVANTYIRVLEGPAIETAQLGIRREELVAMARELDLWYHCDP